MTSIAGGVASRSNDATGSLVVGISGFKHSAAVALCHSGALASVCQQERLTRVRGAGVERGGFPGAALEAVLEAVGRAQSDIAEVVVAEPGLRSAWPEGVRELDHHRAHAGTAFLTSPFEEAAVVVSDNHSVPGVTVWRGRGAELTSVDVEWRGPSFASIYALLTTLLGYAPRSESIVEGLARLQANPDSGRATELITYRDGTLCLAPEFDEYVENVRDADVREISLVAGSVQCRLGDLIVGFCRDVARSTGETNLCLGGGLFYNTYINSAVRQASIFRQVHIPVNPGNGGVAAGCALIREYERGAPRDQPRVASPFLGPEYTNEQIKKVLDNCKLRYGWVDDSQLIGLTAEALTRGEFVAWFRGGMEWGRRALGNRSIFANPSAPFALENLNRFLKHRPAYRMYGLVVRDEDLERFFDGPACSPYMECEFTVRETAPFGPVQAPGTRRLQVQTVGSECEPLRQLLAEFGQRSGVPVLVNTSLNSFQEPIVCSPRDAVRVFFGNGIDVLFIGNFVVRK